MKKQGDVEAAGTSIGLVRAAGEEVLVGAKAEALDTDLKRGAAAMEQMLEEGFETEGTPDVVFDFGDFALSKFFSSVGRPGRCRGAR